MDKQNEDRIQDIADVVNQHSKHLKTLTDLVKDLKCRIESIEYDIKVIRNKIDQKTTSSSGSSEVPDFLNDLFKYKKD